MFTSAKACAWLLLIVRFAETCASPAKCTSSPLHGSDTMVSIATVSWKRAAGTVGLAAVSSAKASTTGLKSLVLIGSILHRHAWVPAGSRQYKSVVHPITRLSPERRLKLATITLRSKPSGVIVAGGIGIPGVLVE